jgi:hypothetical protein
MAVGREERFEERKPRVIGAFGDDHKTLEAVYRVFELVEMAWHDCYAEITLPEEVVDDVLLCSGGTITGLIDAAHMAVIDRRDLSVWASDIRSNAANSS